MAHIKKPKLLKYRKAPKKSASLTAWRNYSDHMTEVDKKNRAKIAEYEKKKTDVKKKHTLVTKLSGIGRASRVKFKG